MPSRRTPLLIHLLGAAAASALAAYWILRLLAPGSLVAPAAAPAAAMREPDAALAARMFGDVSSGPAAVALNVQVNGVFAAGADSSAVIAVEGRPSRAVLLGQEVTAGLRLVEVRPDAVLLEHDGARTRYAVPFPSIAKSSAPSALFRRDGNTLTAPSQDVPAAATKGPTSARALAAPAPGALAPAGPPGAAGPPGMPRPAPDEAPMPGRLVQPPMAPAGAPPAPLPGGVPGG